MRVAWHVLYFVLVFCIPQLLFSQQPTASAQRDPQALNILLQSINATGGPAAVAAVQDLTGTGTITYNWAGHAVTGSVTVYAKGLNEFRMDSDLPSGNQSLVVNGRAATLTPVYGKKTKLSTFSVMTAGSMTFPAARIANDLADSSISVTYLGSVTWNALQAYRVHVAPPLDPQLSIGPNLSGLGEFDLYFDPASYQLVGLAEKVWWGNDLSQSYVHELLFSNYKAANGLLVPFTITEKFGGQKTWSMTLSSVTFNNGIADSLFAL